MANALITEARERFHEQLVSMETLSVSADGIASNADKSQVSSRTVALSIARALGAAEGVKLKGQTAGKFFEQAVTTFIEETMASMTTVRPGKWSVLNVGGSRAVDHVARFHPYRHLDDLAHVIEDNQRLQSVLGNSYVISPDILVVREAVSDWVLNAEQPIVDDRTALRSPFRAMNVLRGAGEGPDSLEAEFGDAPGFIHAVVSCKWTMRSDRSQNTRSEALNLIRNRKGRAPHIVSVTAEPSPSRIASLALGTGDIDVVYHFALPELVEAVNSLGNDEAKSMLEILVEGDRLRDISDLPLDLSV